VSLSTIDAEGVKKLAKNETKNLRLITVVATWCGPCVEELSELVTIQRMYRGRQFEMLTISLDGVKNRDQALKFLTQKHASSANYLFDSDDRDKFAEALDLITEAVPFPRVLGRVCSHPCQSQCTRGKIDKPVAICALKRFVADSNSTESSLKRAQTSNNGGQISGPAQVAIIGSGPAGLTAARDLARLGHRATVFEALPVAGVEMPSTPAAHTTSVCARRYASAISSPWVASGPAG
jgi:thiol-disulfide isomerase/thioredoxin